MNRADSAAVMIAIESQVDTSMRQTGKNDGIGFRIHSGSCGSYWLCFGVTGKLSAMP
ncbi:hypothetical protein N8766_06785 [bacterium]|nr:hypothetical protein [bacterium]